MHQLTRPQLDLLCRCLTDRVLCLATTTSDGRAVPVSLRLTSAAADPADPASWSVSRRVGSIARHLGPGPAVWAWVDDPVARSRLLVEDVLRGNLGNLGIEVLP